jgi:bifunctional DNA-binding transcriptional regulator/antitoxin component of YhaV-PrlF toxin-antitoxin module
LTNSYISSRIESWNYKPYGADNRKYRAGRMVKSPWKGHDHPAEEWRDEMGIENGDIVKAKKEGSKVVIETQSQIKPTAPYRVFSAGEITEFLAEDRLPDELASKVEKKVSNSPKA